MKRLIVAASLMCLAASAFAASAPDVSSPKNGDKLGPNVDVVGKTEGKQFVIIITDVYVKGELLKAVPGHRHWTDDEGNFALRIAIPRVRGVASSDLKYKIRVFTMRPDREKSPETVVTCSAK